MDSLIPLLVVIPLATAFLIPVLWKVIPGIHKYLTLAGLLFITCLAVSMMLSRNGETMIYKIGGWEPVNGIPIGIHLVVDGLSELLLIIINLIGFLAVFYSLSYIKKFTSENYYYTLFNLMIAGMNGVVITGDLFNLFVFLEVSLISTYALVAFGTEKEELEASFKYQVLGGVASMLILFSIGLIYWVTGTLNISDIGFVLKTNAGLKIILFIQVFLIAGFGLKSAMIPFHAWLPDAHSSAPAPVSAMMSGVLIKAVGIYVILRLFFNMMALSHEIAIVITIIGVLSMVFGVFIAIGQWDIKRLFAYHSISQMGYVVMGIGIGMIILTRHGDKGIAALAITGGLFHLVNHAAFKGLLFLNAGAIEHSLGTRDLHQLGGLSEHMPVTSVTTFTASMAISGIPPFNGFFSKLLIIVAAVQGGFYFLAFLAVVVSIITLASFLKVHRFAFAGKTKVPFGYKIREVPFTMCFSMIVLAILCLLMSLLIFPGIREIILTPAVDVLIKMV